jgi:hypothetical protein
MGNLHGSSAVLNDDLTSTEVRFANGSTSVFHSGSTISLSIADWLAAAGVQLDGTNTHVSADLRDASHQPYYRTTGVTVTLDIEYSNSTRCP